MNEFFLLIEGMLLELLAWRLPVNCLENEMMHYGSPDQIWYQDKVPGFRWLSKGGMPEVSNYGMTYETVVITPPVSLQWTRDRLEQRGVQFKRVYVGSLTELEGLGHGTLHQFCRSRRQDACRCQGLEGPTSSSPIHYLQPPDIL